MEEVSIVGVDLAKQVFQVHGAAADGRGLFRKKLSRPQFAKFTAAVPPCVMAMEACWPANRVCWSPSRWPTKWQGWCAMLTRNEDYRDPAGAIC